MITVIVLAMLIMISLKIYSFWMFKEGTNPGAGLDSGVGDFGEGGEASFGGGHWVVGTLVGLELAWRYIHTGSSSARGGLISWVKTSMQAMTGRYIWKSQFM